ncbi:MAG: hypothetical protein F9K47_13385 [Burkholderiales bacterium]|nr:MAG: hypothetical protein F9K47_13385 [Burkholderiales bacterium]
MTDRRAMLRWGIGLGLLASSGGLLRSLLWPPPLDTDETALLKAYAAALLGDGEAAEAILGALVARANQDRGLRRIVRRGLSAVERLAKEGGHASLDVLSTAATDRLLETIANAQAGSVLRIAYERLRLEIYALYFARPEVVASLALPGPPQPAGFPGHEDAP